MNEQSSTTQREPKQEREERRPLPYEAPRLSYLGSMREITLASMGGRTDGVGQGLQSG